MGIQSITNEELLTGAVDLVADCILKKVTPKKYLEISNGENTAAFDLVIYKSDPELYWKLKSDRLKLKHKDSDAFVSGYNNRAQMLGMPGFYFTIDDVIVRIITFMICSC
jgi:hypothetical protein